MRKQKATEQATKPTKEQPKSNAWEHQPWELVKPVDFDGEDTSLTEEHLGILK
jgi:hypothetical protein